MCRFMVAVHISKQSLFSWRWHSQDHGRLSGVWCGVCGVSCFVCACGAVCVVCVVLVVCVCGVWWSLAHSLSSSLSFLLSLLLSLSCSLSFLFSLLDAECRAPIGVTSEAPQHCCENNCHNIRYCDNCPRKHSPSWQVRATSAKTSCYEPRTSRLGVLVFCPSVSCSRVWGVSPLPQILHQKILRDRIRNPTEFHCLQDSPNLKGTFLCITTGLCVAASLVTWLIDGNDVVIDLFTDPLWNTLLRDIFDCLSPPRRPLSKSEAESGERRQRSAARRFAFALVHVGPNPPRRSLPRSEALAHQRSVPQHLMLNGSLLHSFMWGRTRLDDLFQDLRRWHIDSLFDNTMLDGSLSHSFMWGRNRLNDLFQDLRRWHIDSLFDNTMLDGSLLHSFMWGRNRLDDLFQGTSTAWLMNCAGGVSEVPVTASPHGDRQTCRCMNSVWTRRAWSPGWSTVEGPVFASRQA